MTLVHDLGAAALETARNVAERLRDPARVARIAVAAFADVPADLMLPGWQPASLLLGHPGVGLLHMGCASDDDQWSAVAHAHLAAAVAVVPSRGPAAVGNLVLPSLLGAENTGGYIRLLDRSTGVLADHTRARVAALRARRAAGFSYLDYDVVTGLTGQGRVLLAVAGRGDERAADALAGVLAFLVELTEPLSVDGVNVPGWWCAPDCYPVPRDRTTYPRGDFNVGAAHGICGPLALLSLAYRAGHRVPGTLAAVRRITDWLLSHAYADERGHTSWPGRVAFEEETGAARVAPSTTARPGWCYGISGIVGTLHLAGMALADESTSRLAVVTLSALLRRPIAELGGEDPGFCHGLAGVLHAGVRLARQTGDAELWRGADRLAAALTSLYDVGSVFGYRQLVRTAAGPVYLESPALIDGAAGVALALLTYAQTRGTGPQDPPPTAWDAVFLTS
ncbi:lanthionine synthetase C family protein [Streptomyces sp. NPDC048057]|uniref:lanthionine synthetase C family protein n=1 Tax=Streptomyces sp. NPDC048057 TaxID=3155628 RepID=UPI0033E79A4F